MISVIIRGAQSRLQAALICLAKMDLECSMGLVYGIRSCPFNAGRAEGTCLL